MRRTRRRTGGGDSDWTYTGNVIGASFTEDYESLMEGADGTSGEEEESGGLKTVVWRRRQHGGRKAQARVKGGRQKPLGSRDSADETRRQSLGGSDDANEAIFQWRHHRHCQA